MTAYVSLFTKPVSSMPVRVLDRSTVQVRERRAGLRITYGAGSIIPNLDEDVAMDLIASRFASPVATDLPDSRPG